MFLFSQGAVIRRTFCSSVLYELVHARHCETVRATVCTLCNSLPFGHSYRPGGRTGPRWAIFWVRLNPDHSVWLVFVRNPVTGTLLLGLEALGEPPYLRVSAEGAPDISVPPQGIRSCLDVLVGEWNLVVTLWEPARNCSSPDVQFPREAAP